MRLAGIEKLGFYATPPKTRELIAEWLELGGNFARALDPTAGDGGPLAYLASVLETCSSSRNATGEGDSAAALKQILFSSRS